MSPATQTLCTGSLNSGLCMTDSNEIHNPTCRCSTGYIRYKDRCLKGTNNTELLPSHCISKCCTYRKHFYLVRIQTAL